MAAARAKLGLPKIAKTSDLMAAASTITSAVAAGQDTPNEAALSSLIGNVPKSKQALAS